VTRKEAVAGGTLAGLCRDDAPDADRVGQWLFDTYLLERAKGRTEVDARRRLLEVMRSGSR
jgi:hypothetical protein